MDAVEWKLRRFVAAFYAQLEFSNWVRTRARELQKQGQKFEVVLIWGRRRFHVGRVPHGNPYFAIERTDGTVERSPWVED